MAQLSETVLHAQHVEGLSQSHIQWAGDGQFAILVQFYTPRRRAAAPSFFVQRLIALWRAFGHHVTASLAPYPARRGTGNLEWIG